MRIQNLTSIVNKPKRDSLLLKITRAVQNRIQSRRGENKKGNKLPSKNIPYKPILEKDVNDSIHI